MSSMARQAAVVGAQAAGTLYPVARFDLRDEPRIVSAPPAGGCLMPVEWR